uniref:ABM domain-containing protein n=1 Tax=Alexandrium andersonii TaxID=327968 RepID=A0A7S2NB28_9DINO|mmetsp:Transcript_89932/g.201323  ORF Transcript_89932/g.201323 Transcript_89932/m.201323 type:complete len:227 (+) Transcript_89932:91-771(+)
MPISFFITFEIRTESCTMEQWLTEFNKRAKAAEADEPGTLAYVAMTRADQPTHVMIYERYQDMAAMQTHGKHPAHAAFMKSMAERKLTKRAVGQAMFEEKAGFPFGAKPIKDPQSLLFTAFTMKPPGKATGEQVLAGFAKGEGLKFTAESEPGTVSYVAGVLQGAQRGDPPLENGMFCVVEAYTDKQAFVSHLKRVMPKADPEKAGFVFWKPSAAGFLSRPASSKL